MDSVFGLYMVISRKVMAKHLVASCQDINCALIKSPFVRIERDYVRKINPFIGAAF